MALAKSLFGQMLPGSRMARDKRAICSEARSLKATHALPTKAWASLFRALCARAQQYATAPECAGGTSSAVQRQDTA
eukprot:9814826-Alexandrium_andersonii.AAC.1